MKTLLFCGAALAIAAAAQILTSAPAAVQGDRPPRIGLLESSTLFTVYGRGFGVAPILGRLGTYKDMDDMAAGTQEMVTQIAAATGGKQVIVGIHLVYALAIPCGDTGDCLQYLRKSIAQKYIEPAAQRGWVVVLDTQLGRSDPVTQINRMIEAGFLKYENVHVAIDPEFHLVSGHLTPGIPVGSITADQINQTQRILDGYVASQNLKTRKILMVHQFGAPAGMVQDKKAVTDFSNIDLVVDADGLGSPALKVQNYNSITNSRVFPFIHYRGIKIFFRDPGEERNHFDTPPMTIDQIFGLAPVPGRARMATQPNVVIIA